MSRGPSFRLLIICVGSLAFTQVRAAAYHAPHNAYGAPDLSGNWTNLSLTSIERPAEAASLIVNDADGAALERRLTELRVHPANDALGQRSTEAWPDAHLARINGQVRTSWIVSPADGKIPYSPEGRRILAAQRGPSPTAFDNPENRPDAERCLVASWGATGPPILAPNYAANYQIMQSPGEVAILSEMNHDVRIVRLNSPHQPAVMRRWMGDSVGHWDKDTLVVETINFAPGYSYSPWGLLLSADAKVTERFTRVSATQILYQYEVDDPAIFTQVWRGEMPFEAAKGPPLEFACHEGNYSLPDVLAGVRHAEAETAAAAAPRR